MSRNVKPAFVSLTGEKEVKHYTKDELKERAELEKGFQTGIDNLKAPKELPTGAKKIFNKVKDEVKKINLQSEYLVMTNLDTDLLAQYAVYCYLFYKLSSDIDKFMKSQIQTGDLAVNGVPGLGQLEDISKQIRIIADKLNIGPTARALISKQIQELNREKSEWEN